MQTDEFKSRGVIFREMVIWNGRRVRGFAALEGRAVVVDANTDPESPFFGQLGQKYARRWVAVVDGQQITRKYNSQALPAVTRYQTARQAAEAALRRIDLAQPSGGTEA